MTPVDVDSDNRSSADELLNEAIEKAVGGIVMDSKTSAPIILPSRDELAVRVIPVASFNQLIDANKDKELASNVFWACIGGLIGIISNMVAANKQPNSGEWILLGVLLILCALSFVFSKRFSKRAKNVLKSIGAPKDKNS